MEVVERKSTVRRAADALLEDALQVFGTYTEMAKAIGVCQDTVRYWYWHGNLPREATLVRLEDALAARKAAAL